MRSKKQSVKPKRTKVQRHLWLIPAIDSALVRAAESGKRDINRQASIYIEEGLQRAGLLEGAEARG